jgi:hypothetical protein
MAESELPPVAATPASKSHRIMAAWRAGLSGRQCSLWRRAKRGGLGERKRERGRKRGRIQAGQVTPKREEQQGRVARSKGPAASE